MPLSVNDRKALMSVAMGRSDPDVVIMGGTLANVLSGEFHRADIFIKSGHVAAIIEGGINKVPAGVNIVDATGGFILPGFIDPHMHLESSSLLPSEFAKAVVSRGVTTVAIDPHEFGNIIGLRGIRALLDSTSGLPLHFFLRVPARVPELAFDLETPGFIIDDDETEQMIRWEEAVCLAGDISPNFILNGDDMQLRRMKLAEDLGRFVSGYVPQLPEPSIDAMVNAGVQDSHVPKTVSELVLNIRHGLHVLLTPRPGRFEADAFRELGQLVQAGSIDSRRISLCTDDVLVHELISDGHLDARLRMALREGVPPMAAIQMATINTAELLRRPDLGAVAPGRWADIVIVDDLERLPVRTVLFKGEVVKKGGEFCAKVEASTLPEFTKDTIRSDMPESGADLKIAMTSERAAVACNVLVASHPKTIETCELTIEDGHLQPSVSDDIAAVAVVERYHNSGRIGKGFVKGFGLKRGAVSSSTNHNNHHVFAIGADYDDMQIALAELKVMGGGYVAVLDGKVLAKLALPVIGMISELPADELAAQMVEFERAMVEDLGCSGIRRPMYALNFLCSPVVMNYGITDLGLVDSVNMERVELLAGK
jgi:adenine deaminase